MEVERAISQTEKFITISDKSDSMEIEDKSPLNASDHDENLSQKSSSSNEELHQDSENVKVLDQAKVNAQQNDEEKILEIDLEEDDDDDGEKSFLEMEAKLNAVLEADRKQKEDQEEAKKKEKSTQGGKINKRLAQMLQMPEYGQILKMQPTLRHTSATSEIDLDEDVFAPPPSTRSIKDKGIQELRNRYKLHTSVQKPKTEQHFKFHISKKEEDSQGVNRLQVDEVDYVQKLTVEEQEEMSSPVASAPGVRMSEMKQKLMDEIRARRAQKYEEKLKTHAMYSEEKDLEGKSEEKDEEEILLDDDDITDEDEDDDEEDDNENENDDNKDDDDDDEIDENKEEDLETLLNGEPDKKSKKKPKKQRKRLIFLEEEASETDEDGNHSLDEDEDKMDRENNDDLEFIDDRPIFDDDDEDEEEEDGNNKTNSDKKSNQVDNNNTTTNDNKDQTNTKQTLYPPSQSFEYSNTDDEKSQDMLISQTQSQDFYSQDLFSDFEKEVESRQQHNNNNNNNSNSNNEKTPSSPHPSLFDPTKTPIIPSSILNFQRASPIGPWNSTLTNRHQISTNSSDIFRHPTSRMSPLMSRMSSDVALDVFCKDMNKKNSTTPTTPSTNTSSTLPIEVAKLVGTQPEPSSFDLDEEFENICSAKFPSQAPETPIESQGSEAFGFDEEDDDDDEDDLLAPSRKLSNEGLRNSTQTPINSNNHHNDSNLRDQNTKHETPRTSVKNTIGSKRLDFQMEEDGDDENDEDDDDDKDSIIGIKIQRKRKRCLKFSDDEDTDAEDKPDASDSDEEEDENSVAQDEEEEEGEDDEEMNNSEIEYDENEEIIVKSKFKSMVSTKTGKIRKEFIEGEAELSGSEVGSDDEDERGLDHYEDDGGDNEHFDEEKMKDEVGRIHLKQLIDDDQREIRLLQDAYLEDGDLHTDGKGRERQYKWKNADQGGGEGMFISNDGDYALGDDIDEIDSETQRIKERQEREKWKKEHPEIAKKLDHDEEEVEEILKDSQHLKMNHKLLLKIEKQASYSESIHMSNNNNNRCPTFVKKGSFLQREMSSMSRLAEMTKINDSVAKTSKQNFVFSVVTPPTNNNNSSSKKTERVKPPKKIIKVDNSVAKLESKSESQLFKWM